jgi:hypothetical protein
MRSAFFIMLLWSSAGYAQGVDSKPTVRSEMSRGNDAGFYCQHKNIGNFRETSDCISVTLNINSEQQKASNAFKLGMYSTALFQWESTHAIVTSNEFQSAAQ